MPESGRKGVVHALHRSNGGVPKTAIDEARVDASGLEGDRQRNRKHHGGPDRAICLYSIELIEALQGEGHPIVAGATGENITVRGIDWRQVLPGARLVIGSIVLEVTDFAWPCKTIRPAFLDGDSNRISHKLHPGWSRTYARVTGTGTIRPGDEVELTVE
jgi:MOSC domain-containing protein YiiM